jgi:hypothetical protein
MDGQVRIMSRQVGTIDAQVPNMGKTVAIMTGQVDNMAEKVLDEEGYWLISLLVD